MKKRRGVNILITGSPGVGKSFFSKELSRAIRIRWLEVTRAALEYSWLVTYDEIFNCPILDEEKLLNGIQYEIKCGRNIVDYHSCALFPNSWFDLVLVLRADPDILFDRLKHKGYTDKMVENVIRMEKKNLVLAEALRTFPGYAIKEFRNVNYEDVAENINTVKEWLADWKSNRFC